MYQRLRTNVTVFKSAGSTPKGNYPIAAPVGRRQREPAAISQKSTVGTVLNDLNIPSRGCV
jgi:hypothetical protein